MIWIRDQRLSDPELARHALCHGTPTPPRTTDLVIGTRTSAWPLARAL
jgi:hypothetical protein